ncbi:SDR family NAD(P)-dependent oxidoreductase [Mesobaculum littorinae]|uniref:SDR family NAD(P)-dependent oxidoreductase n=1 Tax=Mesobaculum littorinae TaxID=2486419 RepID=A0A438AHM6_9RHOB|nr:SDR family NAD(P)-dependent oxidoreductase [Mesobaculum littorinae]RVV98192.1 SDR family NAD(P)-dependent oxidoreductase [Mesobaculum littorinae]
MTAPQDDDAPNWTGRRYWIIGASQGLGSALARKLSAVGCDLVLSARNEEALRGLAAALPRRADVVPLDVTDSAAVTRAAEEIGDIDGVVFMAGAYWPMKATDWNAEQVTTMCDVNLTGAARVMGAVVPGMVARRRGHIVLTGSLAGHRGLPGAIGYGASKAGVMHLAETMHADLRGSGVRVQLVNPGFVRTRLTDKNDFEMPFIMEPDRAASEIFEHMTTGSFQRNFPVGFALMFRLARLLPDFLYYRLF